MELTKNFDHKSAERKWYDHWLEKKYFNSKPDDREPYTVVIPPPNVTGVLHMGHCLNNTIQDILIRNASMREKMHAGFREPIMHLLQRKQKWCKCCVKKELINLSLSAKNF